ncbi:hypothetical protein BD769DRAFT_1658423 [Suillus cothurnatus]|nr:hypothetical protein BD769DRAFT_1658423 [Suillus cothurnatus]
MCTLLSRKEDNSLTLFSDTDTEDVWVIIIRLMDIIDVVRCFAISTKFQKLGREVINSRLTYILKHAVGTHDDQLRTALDTTRSVLLSSSALDVMLYGTSSVLQHELRLATPHNAKHILAAFFKNIGFTEDEHPTMYTPPSAIAMCNYRCLQKNGSRVVLINSPTNSVMPVVLSHQSSVDCLFVCSGGLFMGYPELMKRHTAFLPMVTALSTIKQHLAEREYHVEVSNDTWTSACRTKCPTRWRRMNDGLLITWRNGVSPSDITKEQNLQWRLSSDCANLSCTNFIFKHPDPDSGADADCTVNLRIAELRSHNTGLPYITGLLFGAAMMQPRSVPVYLDMGRTMISSIDDLNPRPFVRERGMEPANIIDCNITRKMVVKSHYAFTIIRDHDHVMDGIPPSCNIGPFYKNGKHYRPLTPPRSNMLVIMQDPTKNHQPRDVLIEEREKVTDLIIEADECNDLFNGVIRKRLRA